MTENRHQPGAQGDRRRRPPVERAFAGFAERIGDFKPPEHHLLQVPIAVTVFEPPVGGHIIDRGEGRQ